LTVQFSASDEGSQRFCNDSRTRFFAWVGGGPLYKEHIIFRSKRAIFIPLYIEQSQPLHREQLIAMLHKEQLYPLALQRAILFAQSQNPLYSEEQL